MRCVIVTGVSRGLGAALARVLLGREAVVLGVGRSSAADLQGERYRFVQCDLADVPGIDAALAPAFGALAGLAPRSVCLVNNAATVEPVGLVEMHDGDAVARSLAVNLAAPVALSGLFLRAFADPAVERRIVTWFRQREPSLLAICIGPVCSDDILLLLDRLKRGRNSLWSCAFVHDDERSTSGHGNDHLRQRHRCANAPVCF